MKSKEIIAKLTKAKIGYVHLIPDDKFIIYPRHKPDDMTWPFFQLKLKEIARFNQNSKCICGKTLGCCSDLHHALISRNDVKGNKECKNLIHCSLNVILVCKKSRKDCHIYANRMKSAKFLNGTFSRKYIVDWYNSVNDKMISNLTRIEYYLPNWCVTCGKECDNKFCSIECSKYEDF